MRFIILVTVFSIFGIIMFTTQSFGNSLITPSEVNKIGALEINDLSTKTLMGLNLGTADDITSVTLTFKTAIADTTERVNISLKNINDIEIGSGDATVSPSNTIVTVSLTNSVTTIERSTLKTVSVTIT